MNIGLVRALVCSLGFVASAAAAETVTLGVPEEGTDTVYEPVRVL